ncbi:MAG: FMN-binding negative transcriptional regulator [Thermonemataceae bacterium]|nr:FMN-binding negative transcriptional regulator [Thermonemataceae bacterium]
MYTPSMFRFDKEQDKIDFMKNYSFATMITSKNDIPIATQLPFVIEQTPDKLLLSSHLALANEQAQYIEEYTSLVIFAEPHSYISPAHYDKFESVPTWNYIAVHAYGKAKIFNDDKDKLFILEKMIHFYEQAYQKHWDKLAERFKKELIKEIVAFELEITDLQGQQKLSQNKSEIEKQRIIKHLENSQKGTEKDLAIYMKKTNKNLFS